MSFLTVRSRPWLSSWPVAAWKRRLNSSSLASRGAGGRGEGGVDPLLFGLGGLGLGVDVVRLVELVSGRHQNPPASRVMNRHFIGSLWIARRMASRATSSVTPESSNMTRPGL